MPTSRNFECEATGKACTDPRCKKNFCILDLQERNPRPLSLRDQATVTRGEAEKVVRDWFAWRGKRRPTPAQLERAIRHPKVIAEAKRRAAVIAAWVHARNSIRRTTRARYYS